MSENYSTDYAADSVQTSIYFYVLELLVLILIKPVLPTTASPHSRQNNVLSPHCDPSS